MDNKRLEEIRKRQDARRDLLSVRGSFHLQTAIWDIDFLLAALAERGGEKCVKCGRSASRTITCDACGYQDRRYCAPAPTDGAAVKAACGCVEKVKEMRDGYHKDAARTHGNIRAAMQNMEAAATEIITALESIAPVEACAWKFGDIDNVWQTGCGDMFCLSDPSDPVKYGMIYCYHCGKTIEVAPVESEEGE